MDENPNAAILAAADERGWFVARKTAPVWARQLTEDAIVKSREGPLEAKAGDYVCRGPNGGRWPQKEADLLRKYAPTDDEPGADGFRRWVPKPQEARVFASQVSADLALQTSWGVMRGVAGDFLARPFREDDSGPYEDVWIVDEATFEATYERLDAAAGS